MRHLTVIGSGAFGTTFAQVAADAGARVRILARDPKVARSISRRHRNDKNLPGIVLPRRIEAGTDPHWALRGAEIVLVAVGAQAAETVLAATAADLPSDAIVVSLMKAIELGNGRRMSQVMASALDLTPGRLAVISGPNLSSQLARREPAATVVASEVEATACSVAAAIATDYLRPYLNTDVVGVELCGAVKNVVAFACGVAAGLGYSMNSCATLMTRGLAEMTRLGLAYGANIETFAGLAGVGDLAATCLSEVSRNRQVGYHIGRGLTLDQAVNETGGTAESINSSAAILALAAARGVDMPITEGVVGVVHHARNPRDLAAALLARPHRSEGASYETWQPLRPPKSLTSLDRP